MSFADVKNTSGTRDVAQHLHHAGWCRDLDQHDVVVNDGDFDRDVSAVPHIRDPRTDCNAAGRALIA